MKTGQLIVRKTSRRERNFFDGSAGIRKLSSLRAADKDSLNRVSNLG